MFKSSVEEHVVMQVVLVTFTLKESNPEGSKCGSVAVVELGSGRGSMGLVGQMPLVSDAELV